MTMRSWCMILKIHNQELVIFDLDDTLYKEIDFLKSAYKKIANFIDAGKAKDIYTFMMRVYHNRGDAFGEIIKKYQPNASKKELLDMYRNHFPDIRLDKSTEEFIRTLKKNGSKIGLITDGRSNTQRNKLKALGIEGIFEEVLISEEFGSEKPDLKNFNYFDLKYENYSKSYIADNFNKDFVSPNVLGWRTIGLLDNGKNIHKQNEDLPQEYLPQSTIHSFKEIEIEYVK